MITRKNFLLGSLGAAGVAACGDDGAGGAGGAASTTTTGAASTKAASGTAASGSTKATGASSGANSTSGAGQTSSTGGSMFACASPENMIGTNHPQPHELTVPAADAEAGTEKTYDITGQSAHMHEITVTAANWTTLKETGTVTVTSTQGGMHTHAVTITCAS